MKNPKWHRDEIILALNLYFDEDRGSIAASNPKIIELSKILNILPIFSIKPDEAKFRNANGVGLKLSNFLALDPEYKGKGMDAGSKLDREIFDEFRFDKTRLRKLANGIKSVVRDANLSKKISQIEDDEISVLDSAREGQVLYKLHKIRERDKRIVDAKKGKAMKETGKLECEACGFDFYRVYGKIGEGFIECHHLKPLSNYETEAETKLDDLALVCSNCHRMFHRDMSILTICKFKLIYGM